jgi:hypothetical protein
MFATHGERDLRESSWARLRLSKVGHRWRLLEDMHSDDHVPLLNRRGAALALTITFTVSFFCFHDQARDSLTRNVGLGLALFDFPALHAAGRGQIAVVG